MSDSQMARFFLFGFFALASGFASLGLVTHDYSVASGVSLAVCLLCLCAAEAATEEEGPS